MNKIQQERIDIKFEIYFKFVMKGNIHNFKFIYEYRLIINIKSFSNNI